MAQEELSFWIRIKDATAAAIARINARFQGMRQNIDQRAKAMVKSLFSVRGAIIGLAAVAGTLGYALKQAFEFERYETQFKILLGNLEDARAHIKDLQEFSARTPFQFGDIAQASRQLLVFSDGVMGGRASLELLGDAAAVSGRQIQEVSFWVGRAYSAIASGRPFGEAAMRLQEMGILSGSARGEIEDLSKAGASNAQIWAVLSREMEKAKGGMDELSETGEGLTSTLKDNWKLAVADLGAEFMDLAKDDIKAIIDALKDLRADGTLTEWAQGIIDVLKKVGGVIKTTTEFFGSLKRGIQDIAGYYGDIGPGTFAEYRERQKGVRAKEAEDKEFERMLARERFDRAQHEKELAAEEAKKQEQLAIMADLAEKQKVIDEKRAKEAAEKLEKEQAKALEKLAKEQERLAEKAIRAEIRLRREALKESQAEKGTAEAIFERARSASAQAWEEFKDPSLFRIRAQEEEKEKKARAEYEQYKDRFSAYAAAGYETEFLDKAIFQTDKERAAWRVYQARAKEEEAQKALTDIAKNTAGLKEMLQELLTMKEA